MAAARLKPSVETLPQPRKPRGISVSKTVLSWSRVLPDFVRHERIAQIQHLHQIAVHPIGVDRRLVGVHDLPVSGERLVACRPHFRRHITRRPSGTGRAVGHFLAERLQGQARIADHRVRRRIHLVDVQLVDVAVDDGLLRRIGNAVAEAARRQARAHGEDEVALVQVVRHLIAAHADKQRMVLRERPFGLEGRDHRHIHELRQRFQVVRGARVDDPLAGVDQRVTGCQELVDCGAHIRRVRRRFPALHGTVGVGGLVVCGRGIGNSQDHRARSAAAQHGEGAAHELRRALGLVEIAEPLRHGLHGRCDIVLAVARAAGRHAIGDAQNGRAILIGLRHPGVGVLHAGGIDAPLEGAHPDP